MKQFTPLTFKLLTALTTLITLCQPTQYAYSIGQSAASHRQTSPSPYPGKVKDGRYFAQSGVFSIAVPSDGLAGADEIYHAENDSYSLMSWDSLGVTQQTEVTRLPPELKRGLRRAPQLKERILEVMFKDFSERHLSSTVSDGRIETQELINLSGRGPLLYTEMRLGPKSSKTNGCEKLSFAHYYDGDYIVFVMVDERESGSTQKAQDMKTKMLQTIEKIRIEK